MATNDMDLDMNRPNRGWYIPSIERGRSLVVDLTERGRGLRPCSPFHVGRGVMAFATGRGRGLRPPSPPHVRRGQSVPQLGRGRGLGPLLLPLLAWVFGPSSGWNKSDGKE